METESVTRVLLITDTERLQLIFAALETKGLLELRTAATLTLADLELSASAPDFTFVQSRISGFSSVIMLRHLKKVLPKKAKIILLAGDTDDAAQARQGAVPFLDLSVDDEALEQAIRQVLENKTPAAPKKRAAGQAIAAGKGAEAKAKKSAALPAPVLEKVDGKQKSTRKPVAKEPTQRVPLPPANLPSPGIGEPVPASPPAQGSEELVFPTLSTEESAVLPAPEGENRAVDEPAAHWSGQQLEGLAVNVAQKRSIKSFEAVLGRASGKGVSATEPMDVEDRIDIGPQSSEAEPAEQSGIASLAPELERETSSEPNNYFYGEPLADAIRRAEKKSYPKWIIPVALALLLIPLALYLAVGKKKAAPDSLATSKSVTQPEQRPAEGAPPATTTPPPPLTAPAPTTAPAQAPAAPGSVAEPTAKRGLKALPPFLSGTKPDPGYGKTHPGWQRYIGKQAEYKVFQEAGVYRAIQVIALGGRPLSDQLFSRVLLEFGGIDSYQVQSSNKKGSYLQEEGVAKGGVAVTIYRNKSDRKVKGMVVYYR